MFIARNNVDHLHQDIGDVSQQFFLYPIYSCRLFVSIRGKQQENVMRKNLSLKDS